MVSYDRKRIMLTRNEVTEGYRRSAGGDLQFPDDQLDVRWRGPSLPYVVFGKEQRVSQAGVVENKRLGAALALIKAQQDASRLAATAHDRPRDAGGLVGQCDRRNLGRRRASRPRTHAASLVVRLRV